MSKAILFDLGNTLVKYYHVDEFQPILRRSIDGVLEELHARKIGTVNRESSMTTAQAENREASDFQFSPMAHRLERIFEVQVEIGSEFETALCNAFLKPIFAIGYIYEDVVPTLKKLRLQGFKLGVVSNVPWGSPPELWRDELQRLGMSHLFDSITLCGDVGWRKPAHQIFDYAAKSLSLPCSECTFVGDEPAWDIEGSKAAGMQPILLDRDNRHLDFEGDRLTELSEIVQLLAGNLMQE